MIIDPDTSFRLEKVNDQIFHVIVESPQRFIALSDMMPAFNNFGLYILSEKAQERDGCHQHIYTCQGSLPGEHFIEALQKTWAGTFESDAFSQLILHTSLTPYQVNVLRAYARYLMQISFPESLQNIATTLANEPKMTHLLWLCLEARLDQHALPELFDERAHNLRAILCTANVDVEHIFQTYLDLISATLRMQTTGKDWVAFKFKAKNLNCLPTPRPFYESFVYSPRVEGVHLRSSRLARGGIRWSERDDYRYEVLELMKAQTHKNSIIVPTGAKGGFICRTWNKLRAQGADGITLNAERAYCYELFIKALLDLVDKSPKDEPVLPHNEVDAYFVVAADKGTATFSDRANRLAQEHHFWLDDAFASGGSNGYDHKKMGITARGAWVSLEHHLHRIKLEQPLTFVGVGDMSGDVFGNGLLRPVKLIAAFNHQHIFIDPNPNVEASLQERQRLFNLAQSTWVDYNSKLISRGGGVFERTQSQLTLSDEAANVLEITPGAHPTNEVVRAILKAAVDVLWFGGIGTFIKSEEENNPDVRDRANDAVRVNGNEVRASIVVEGANLGATQAGRVAYALCNGAINTDATDNSAGVDCSDHEVNIKIFLRHKKISEADMSVWLEAMTDDVAALVLENNRKQNEILTLMEEESPGYEPLRQYFKKKGVREGMPRGLQLLQRERHHWTRPELCYLLAHTKNDLTERIANIVDTLPSHLFKEDIMRYFPAKMQQHFGESLCDHPLRSSLLSTVLANHIINTWGPMWALPVESLTCWLQAYHWLRNKRDPDKKDSKRWHVFLAYLQRFSGKRDIDKAYQLVWGENQKTAPHVWKGIWPLLLQNDDIPAVWELGAMLIDVSLTKSSLRDINVPTQTNLSDITYIILHLAADECSYDEQ